MLQIWHYREGTLLKTFSAGVDLEPALNSPLGMSGLVVLLYAWMAFRLQSSAKMLVAIPVASIAGITTTTGACLLALRELTDGGLLLTLVLWLMLLAFTLLLLYSAAQLAEFLTHSITPEDKGFNNHIQKNAVIQLWDRCISGRVDPHSTPIRIFAAERVRLANTVRPLEFLTEFFFSRRPRLLVSAAPAFLAFAALLRLEGAKFGGSIDDALLHWRAQVREVATVACFRNLALLAFAAGATEECLQAFDQLDQLDQLSVEDSRVRITALMQLGKQNEALAAATRAAEPLLTAKTAVARLAAADLFSRASAFPQAAQSLDIPDAIGDDIRILRFGRARNALDELDRLMCYPGFYPTLETVWKPQLTDDSADKVAALLQTALDSTELTLRTADRLCLLMFHGGKLQSVAETALSRFRSTRGIPAVLLMALGSRALQAGKYDDAIAWLEQAQQMATSRDPAVLNNLAVALVRAGRQERYLEALELADSAIKLLPENHILLATRGEVYLALRRTKPALADLEAARQLRPDYPETLLLLARTCTEMGRREEAEKYQKMAEALQQSAP